MNVQEYISSGIVESYVLGLATPEEQREFEAMCQQHAEVLAARTAFELAMEQQAMEFAVAPPASLKEEIFAAVKDVQGAKVVSLDSAPGVRTSWLKYAVAASVLLVGSIIGNVILYNNNKQLKTDYSQAVAQADTAQAQLRDMERQAAVLVGNPSLKLASMKGLDASPASFATVAWDSTTKDVYLMINNLPRPATDKQYQLWALLDGKPIDLGMVPNEYFIGEKKLLLQMKNASGAQAFAITLEKKGGNPTPQGAMYVLGKL